MPNTAPPTWNDRACPAQGDACNGRLRVEVGADEIGPFVHESCTGCDASLYLAWTQSGGGTEFWWRRH